MATGSEACEPAGSTQPALSEIERKIDVIADIVQASKTILGDAGDRAYGSFPPPEAPANPKEVRQGMIGLLNEKLDMLRDGVRDVHDAAERVSTLV